MSLNSQAPGREAPDMAGGPTRVRSVSTLRTRDWIGYAILVLLWIAVNANFWVWWLQPEHVESGWIYWPFTAALAYSGTLLTTFYLYIIGHMRQPVWQAPEPGLRVALITLCVPGHEGLEVIERQLTALAHVSYPHDSWVLDEGNTPAVRAMSAQHGIRYFTRAGVERYNRPGPPFKAKTKAGNVNAWLDEHGAVYDIFVQFDIDHTPRPEYLDRVLGYFRDPRVAWVQAPSIYGNLSNWIARGAAEQELVLQGPLQQGFYGLSETPFIIGSHSTYRTAAVLEIGGFQPTRAEDHLDSLLLAAHGYRAVYVPEPIAVGAGPETFDTYIQQQFAWAMSLVQVLFGYAPRLVWRLRFKQAVQFLFAESWYPLSSTALLVMTAMPLVALVSHHQPSNVGLFDFMLRWSPVGASATIIWLWSRPWRMPRGLGLSWRGVVLHVARWPIVFWAVLNVLLNVTHSYMITRKGSTVSDRRRAAERRRAATDIQHAASDRRKRPPDRRGGLARRGALRQGVGPVTTLRSRVGYLLIAWCMAGTVLWFMTVDAWGLTGVSAAEHQGVEGFALLITWGMGFFVAVYGANVLGGAAELWKQSRRPRRVVQEFGLAIPVLILTTALWGLLLNESAARLDDASDTNLWPGRALIPNAAPLVAATATPDTLPAVVTAATPVPVLLPPPPVDLPVRHVAVGAYDPSDSLRGFELPLEHYFVLQREPHQVAAVLASARSRQAVPLITLEPFAGSDQTGSVLEAIARGDNDEQITAVARTVSAVSPQPVLIRWAHEMDLALLYPWSVADGALYRAAFSHVVSTFRREGVTNVRWVWSPSGNTPAAAYYPGDDFVDYVGMTVLGDEGWDRLFGYDAPQSFSQILADKYTMLAGYGKPMIIAELGVSGTPTYQRAWLTAGVQSLGNFPLIRAVAYQNAVNAPNNFMVTQPDWRISAATFAEFQAAVRESAAE